jgi:hypothetical protein
MTMNDPNVVSPPTARRISRSGLWTVGIALGAMVLFLFAAAVRRPTPPPPTVEENQAIRPEVPERIVPPVFDAGPKPSEPSLEEFLFDEPDEPRFDPFDPGSAPEPPSYPPSSYTSLPPLPPSPGPAREPQWLRSFDSSFRTTELLSSPPPLLPPTGPPGLETLLASIQATAGGLPAPPLPTPAAPRAPIASPAPASSAALLPPGTVIDALLRTRVVTDQPGAVVAQVLRDVTNPSGQVVLPAGTQLFGTYASETQLGVKRLAVRWHSASFAARTWTLPGLPSSAPDGSAGLPAQVNNRSALVFGRAVLLSLIGAGAQLGNPRRVRSDFLLSDREVLAGAASEQLSAVAAEHLQRTLDVSPRLEVPPGTRFQIQLTEPLFLGEVR